MRSPGTSQCTRSNSQRSAGVASPSKLPAISKLVAVITCTAPAVKLASSAADVYQRVPTTPSPAVLAALLASFTAGAVQVITATKS
jgi:hypothetical protein